MTLGPLNNLRKQDLPNATALTGGYCVLLFALFWNLDQVMRNKPEVAQAIGVPHAELIRRYAEITGFEEKIFTEGIVSKNELTVEYNGDPRPTFEQIIIDFIHTMSVRGLQHKGGLEAILFPSLFGEVTASLMENLNSVLIDNTITDQSEIIKVLLGQVKS